ncbi:hypothetical protein [Mycobacterium servetii]|uniref:Uncharacterized protein n=1 Tax=Mycobacterium servetii TaxID=3237418 RepID=A0ABV4C829_9MYCO
MAIAELTMTDLFRAMELTGVFSNALPDGVFARKDTLLVWQVTHAQPTDIGVPHLLRARGRWWCPSYFERVARKACPQLPGRAA